MSTWSSFTTTAANIKERESLLFGDYADNDAIAIKQTLAKEEMLRDLMHALGVTSSTSSALEAALDDHSTQLKRALAYKQLSLWFFDNDQGDGSVNRAKAEYYRGAYDQERVFFNTMYSRSAASVPVYR